MFVLARKIAEFPPPLFRYLSRNQKPEKEAPESNFVYGSHNMLSWLDWRLCTLVCYSLALTIRSALQIQTTIQSLFKFCWQFLFSNSVKYLVACTNLKFVAR